MKRRPAVTWSALWLPADHFEGRELHGRRARAATDRSPCAPRRFRAPRRSASTANGSPDAHRGDRRPPPAGDRIHLDVRRLLRPGTAGSPPSTPTTARMAPQARIRDTAVVPPPAAPHLSTCRTCRTCRTRRTRRTCRTCFSYRRRSRRSATHSSSVTSNRVGSASSRSASRPACSAVRATSSCQPRTRPAIAVSSRARHHARAAALDVERLDPAGGDRRAARRRRLHRRSPRKTSCSELRRRQLAHQRVDVVEQKVGDDRHHRRLAQEPGERRRRGRPSAAGPAALAPYLVGVEAVNHLALADARAQPLQVRRTRDRR